MDDRFRRWWGPDLRSLLHTCSFWLTKKEEEDEAKKGVKI
jgi:hypothetical protein